MLSRDFQDLMAFPDDATLSEREIEVINLTVTHAMKVIDCDAPRNGSFALRGQKNGHGARAIVQFNLCDGAGTVRDGIHSDSAFRVATVIDDVLEWPYCRMVCREESRAELFGELPTGIYSYQETQVLVINTTLGRFIASFHGYSCDKQLGDWYKLYEQQLLLGVAQSLVMMNKNDVVLQESFEKLCSGLLDDGILQEVKNLFRTKLPEITVWGLYHDGATRRLYFS